MSQIRIITDITAQLRPETISTYKITVLPVDIRFGDERFTITANSQPVRQRLFQHMASGPAKPAEALFSSISFQQAYERLSAESQDLLVILNSGKLSNGIARAQSAARSYMGRCQITVMDSMSTSWGLGLIVEAAAKAAAAGASLDAIVRLVRGLLPRIYIVLFVERLDYLEQKGRIGVAQALLGSMLRIKPMLLVEDGDILPMEKVRTRAQAIGKLADFVAEFAAVEKVVILRSPLNDGADEIVGELRGLLAGILPHRNFPVIEYDPILACHLGPQATGVIVYERQ